MTDGLVLRLFRFRPVHKGFDALLRDVLVPDLLAFPDLLDAYVGRQGPDELGERLVASVWSSRAGMTAAVGESFDPPAFHPELLHETTDRRLEILEVDVALRFDRAAGGSPPATGILRLVRGQVRHGDLLGYRDDVRAGTIADVEGSHGPLALYLALEPSDRFVTLSIWRSWSALEIATGGDIRRPIATRHQERIEAWGAAHYEILPNMADPTAAGR